MYEEKNEIWKKIIKCFVSVIMLVIVQLLIRCGYVDAKISSSEITYSVNEMHMRHTYRFFTYIANGQYENAYSLLSEKCKVNEFGNNIDFFKKIVSELNLKENTEILIYNQSVYDKENYILYIDSISIGKKEICVEVYEYDLQNYELYLSVIDGEGL